MVVIVDDHADTRQALVSLLALDGYESRGLASGGEALVFLRQFIPRLIILDFHMPHLCGLDVLAAIKADDRLAAVPVIMFSADGNPDARRQALASGAVEFIVKTSLDWPKLRSVIEGLIGPGEAPGSLPLSPPAPQKEIS